MTDRQRLTWQQFSSREWISLVLRPAGFFSLLSEQWWRWRSADGVVTDLRVMQVRGPGVRWRTPGWKFQWSLRNGSRQEVGLITCERSVVVKGGQTPHSRKRTGELRTDPHRRWSGGSGGWSGRWERLKRGSKRSQTHRRRTHEWYDAHQHLEAKCRVRHHWTCAQKRENVTCEGVLFTRSVQAWSGRWRSQGFGVLTVCSRCGHDPGKWPRALQ